ncbi:rCG63466, partial [Rattus norvegicus]
MLAAGYPGFPSGAAQVRPVSLSAGCAVRASSQRGRSGPGGRRVRQDHPDFRKFGQQGRQRHFLLLVSCSASPCSSQPPSFVPNFPRRCNPPSPPL